MFASPSIKLSGPRRLTEQARHALASRSTCAVPTKGLNGTVDKAEPLPGLDKRLPIINEPFINSARRLRRPCLGKTGTVLDHMAAEGE